MPAIKKLKIQDCKEPLVEVREYDFVVEPAYFKADLSETKDCLLRKGVVEKLLQAQKKLLPGMRFKIWDGFRKLAVQERLFKALYKKLAQDNPGWNGEKLDLGTQEFVAKPSYDPACPCPHNTGGAVDLTIIKNGKDLDMGTVFDEFSVAAHTNYFKDKRPRVKAHQEVHENRMILLKSLQNVGFINYSHEWWHFSYGDQMWADKKGMEKAIYGSMEI